MRAIIIPTGSFCLIENREDSINALKCFYEHLNPGGRLIVDIMLPYDWKTGRFIHRLFLCQMETELH